LRVKVSIITVNYNGYDDTCALIESIPLNDKSLEVIVVDNASRINEAEKISAKYPLVKTIRSEQNLGFAGGNNLGIKEASGDYLFFINNDTYLKDFNISALIDRLNSSDDIGMVCPKIRFAWENNPIQFAGYTPLSRITLRNKAIGYNEQDKGLHNEAHPTPYAHGAAMMAKREAIEKVGVMPECYFLYYEELDWSMMFRRAGFQIWYEPACTVFHKESRSTGVNSPLKAYYITRNRLLFISRNEKSNIRFASYIYIIAVVALRDIIKYLFKGQFRQINATVKGIFHFFKI
jgi:GT2 family glycosyltransferase